jgi:hypothetical protein
LQRLETRFFTFQDQGLRNQALSSYGSQLDSTCTAPNRGLSPRRRRRRRRQQPPTHASRASRRRRRSAARRRDARGGTPRGVPPRRRRKNHRNPRRRRDSAAAAAAVPPMWRQRRGVALQVEFGRQILKPVFHLIGFRNRVNLIQRAEPHRGARTWRRRCGPRCSAAGLHLKGKL